MNKATLKEVLKYTFIGVLGLALGKFSYNTVGGLLKKTPGVNW